MAPGDINAREKKKREWRGVGHSCGFGLCFYKHPENDPLAVSAPRNINVQKKRELRGIGRSCDVWFSGVGRLFALLFYLHAGLFVMVSLAFVLWSFMCYFRFGFYRPREEFLVPQRPSPIKGVVSLRGLFTLFGGPLPLRGPCRSDFTI